jgi:hypothetical protein
MDALSKELASQGEKTPNRIPISMAMAKLEQEFTVARPLAVSADDHSPEAEIFRGVIQDPSRAAQVLAGSEEWRKGPTQLAASILPGVPGNGFSVGLLTLGAEEWKQLHAQLLRSGAK